MTDVRTRQIERAAQAGDRNAAAALLRERVRRGQVTAAGLEVAAYMGDPVAQLAVGGVRAGARKPQHVLRALSEWGRGYLIVAARLLVRGELQALYLRREPGEAINAALAWAMCPCAECAKRCARAAARCQPVVDRTTGRAFTRERDPWSEYSFTPWALHGRAFRSARLIAHVVLGAYPQEYEHVAPLKEVISYLSTYVRGRSRLDRANQLRSGDVARELRLFGLGLRTLDAYRV